MKNLFLVLVLLATPSTASDWSFIEASPTTQVSAIGWAMIGPSPIVVPEKKEKPRPKYRRAIYVGAVW